MFDWYILPGWCKHIAEVGCLLAGGNAFKLLSFCENIKKHVQCLTSTVVFRPLATVYLVQSLLKVWTAEGGLVLPEKVSSMSELLSANKQLAEQTNPKTSIWITRVRRAAIPSGNNSALTFARPQWVYTIT